MSASPRLTLRQRWYRLRTSYRFPFVLFFVMLCAGGLSQIYCYRWGREIERLVEEHHRGDITRIDVPASVTNGFCGSMVRPLLPIREVVMRPRDRVVGMAKYVGAFAKEDFQPLKNCFFLRELALCGVRPPEVSRELASFTQIRELSLHHVKAHDAEAFCKLTKLDHLGLVYVDPGVIPHLLKMKNLKSLSLHFYYDSSNDARSLARHSSLPKLELDVHSDEQLLAVTTPPEDGSPPLSNLRHLRLSADNLTALGMMNLKFLPRLEHLEIAFGHITDCELAILKRLPHLKSLYFGSCNELTDDLVEQLAEFDHLQSLNITETKISEQGLLRVASLPKLRRLRIDKPSPTLEQQIRDRLPPGCELVLF